MNASSSHPAKSLQQLGDELEMAQTLFSMRQIIRDFVEDDEAYSPAEQAAKRRLSKLIREEYVPLYLLSQRIPAIKTVRLAKRSNQGPDAFLMVGEQEIAVQITTTGEDEETYLERTMLAQGRPVFPRRQTHRDPVTKAAEQSGRMLQTRGERTTLLISEAMVAVQRKIENYREGTQVLLLSMRQSSKGQEADWLTRLHRELAGLGEIPYEAVYACTQSQVFKCWPTSELLDTVSST